MMFTATSLVDYLEKHIPVWAKIVTGIVTLAMFLMGAIGVGAGVLDIKPDIRELQAYQRSSEPIMEFLVCRAFQRDAGNETGACVFLLRDTDFYSEFKERGIIPENY